MTTEPNLSLPEISPAFRALARKVVLVLSLLSIAAGLVLTTSAVSADDDAPPAACLRAIDLGADLRVALGETDDLIQRARAAQERGDEARAGRLANAALARANESAEIATERAAAERACRGEEPRTTERDSLGESRLA